MTGQAGAGEVSAERRWLAETLQYLGELGPGAVAPGGDALLAVAQQLAYKTQLHDILTRVNEAIVRIREPDELYLEACRIATSTDLFRMAWIGLVDAGAGVLRPVAWAGAEEGYLARIRVSVADDPEGRGPSGSAIREGRHFVCDDFETDERMGPWRVEALRRGYRSSAAFPLVLEGRVFGAFTLYGRMPRFFDAAAVGLLATLASDISFAVGSAQAECRRCEAEARLREAHDELEARVQQRTAALAASERKISEILASITDCHYALDRALRFTGINDHALAYFGMPREAFLGRSLCEVFPVVEGSFVIENFNRAVEQRVPVHFDFHSLVVDRWAEMHAYPVSEGLAVYFRDITERRRLLEQVQLQAERLERRVQERTAELALHAQRLAILHQIDHAVLAAQAPAEMARLVAEGLQQAARARRVTVASFNFPAWTAEILADAAAVVEPDRAGSRVPLAGWPWIEEIRTGGPVAFDDLSSLPPAALPGKERDRALAEGIRSATLLPLAAGGEVIGLLAISRAESGPLPPEALELAAHVAGSQAVAQHHALLHEQVEAGRRQLQALSRRLVEMQERERGYVADRLFNQVGQVLAAVKLQLRALEQGSRQGPAVRQLAGAKSALDQAMRDLHDLASSLRPVSLDQLGLAAALKQCVVEFGQEQSIGVGFEAEGPERAGLPEEVETALYRVAQEALANVALHARASRVSVRLAVSNDALVLSIEDDGAGFAPGEIARDGALGLLGMRERVAALGGRFSVQSCPGTGTTIVVEVPLAGRDGAA